MVLFFPVFIKSQINLVLNGGFEMHDTCPTNVGQFNYVDNWNILLNSPDYYNSCASYSISPNSSVPYNFLGYQYPASGNAYSGISTFIDGCCPEYREFMGAQLVTPLVIGQKYYVAFKLVLTLGYTSNSGADKVGLRFANVQHTQFTPPLINNMADVYTTSIITDSLNWTTIFGMFIADSSYGFIEMGNFFENDSTNIQVLRPQASNWSYYYVDDVCISTDSLYSLNWTNGIDMLFAAPEFNLYPNPSTGKVRLKVNSASKGANIFICDVYGNEMKNVKINSEEIEFQEGGIYFITISNRSSRTTKKIVINK